MSLRITEEEYAQLVGRKRQTTAHCTPSLTPSDGAKRLLQIVVEAGIAGPWYREFTFHEQREWRLDVANPERKICIEVDGAVHRIKKRFLADIEKHNALILAGWRYLRVTPCQVDSGEALVLVQCLCKL